MTELRVDASADCTGTITVHIEATDGYATLTEMWGDIHIRNSFGRVSAGPGVDYTFRRKEPGVYHIGVNAVFDGGHTSSDDATVTVPEACPTTTTAPEPTTTVTLPVDPPTTLVFITPPDEPIVAPPATRIDRIETTTTSAPETIVSVPVTLPQTGAHANVGTIQVGGAFLLVGLLLVALRRRLAR